MRSRSARFLFLFLATSLAGCPNMHAGSQIDGGSTLDAARELDAALEVDAAEVDAAALDAAIAPDAGPWDQCNVPSDCVLASSGCCNTCATPTLEDVDAVASSALDRHFAAVCPSPSPCPPCAGSLPPNPSLLPTCQSGTCRVYDISRLPTSRCMSDADCILRYANCCGCSGSPSEVIAINTDANSENIIEAFLCDTGTCPTDCIRTADPGFVATCDLGTHQCAATPR